MIQNLFFRPIKQNTYLYDNLSQIGCNVNEYVSEKNKEIRLALVIDSEFWGSDRKCISLQIKGIKNDNNLIFAHPDLENFAIQTNRLDKIRHPITRSEFVSVDYLKNLGIDATIKSLSDYDKSKKGKNSAFKRNTKNYPVCQIDVYSHFAIAELLMMFQGQCREDIVKIITHGKYKKIELKRRLKVYTANDESEVMDSINLPWIITIEGIKFKVRLRIIDTCALHGVASYADLCQATGIELSHKNALDDWKERMNEAYFQLPEIFDAYSLGDLEVYNILEKNAQNFLQVYQNLEIDEYYQPPKLTIGATVQDLFKAVLFKHFNISPKDKENQNKLIELCQWGSALSHKTYVNTTRCLLAKVSGGRCRNNRPLTSYLEKTIIDADIASAYGTGLRNQDYPIGKPIIEDYENLPHNKYLTLREWLKYRKYGKKNYELINGLWHGVVSTKQNPDGSYQTLKLSQDFVSSWFDFRYDDIAKMPTDTDNFDKEINPKTGKIKIFNYQIINGIINSDFIEWLMNIASQQQKNELLDNLYIKASCYYPSYSKVETLEDLLDAWQNWKEENTVISQKKQHISHKLPSGQIIKIINEPTYWIGLNIGNLLVDKLLEYRKFYQERDGKKSPMQTLFKLICNTLYGVFCSPYFDISNTVVGNNITGRCRAMAWYMEKGLFGLSTITDGCQLDINKVCYPSSKDRRLNGYNTVNLYQDSERDMKINREIILRPLDNCDKIEHFYDETVKLKLYKNNEITIIDNPNSWLNEKLLEHLQKQFKNVSVLHEETLKLSIDIKKSLKENRPIPIYKKQKGIFSIEIKDIYDYGCFHGASNYLLSNRNNTIVKMRSYENHKHHYTFELSEKDEYLETSFYDETIPSEYFLQQLVNARSVKRSKPFKKMGILKVADFRNNASKWLELGFVCGDSIEKTGMLKEISLSQFTYRTMEQYLAIEKEFERNKRRYEQSWEGFFINEDGTLNYQDMIETIDKLIISGATSINEALDKHRNRKRDINIDHPEKAIYEYLKETAIAVKKSEVLTEDWDEDEYSEDQESYIEGDLFS